MTDTPPDPLAALDALDAIEYAISKLPPSGSRMTQAAERRMAEALDFLRVTLDARLSGDDLVLVRRDTGGVFPDGTTNHPAIDFDALTDPDARPSGDEALRAAVLEHIGVVPSIDGAYRHERLRAALAAPVSPSPDVEGHDPYADPFAIERARPPLGNW